MATVNTVSTLDGLFKEVYADKLQDLQPDTAQICKEVPFREAEMLGKLFHQPVALSSENGVTYALSGDGAFAINSPIAMATQDAQIQGAQMLLASRFDYEVLAKSTSNKKAFMRATELVMRNMLNSGTKRLEADFLYAGSGWGVTLSSANVNATTTAVTFTLQSWADGLWSGLENSIINFYTLPSTPVGGDFTITKVNVNTRTLTVTGSAGDITALDAATAGGISVFPKGSLGKTMTGIEKILTTSGSIFNIDNSVYSLWAGNTYDVGNTNLTLTKILDGASLAVNKGLDEDATLYVSPKQFAQMASNESTLRRYNEDNGDAKSGFRRLEFYFQGGLLTVKPHLICKRGEAFLLPMKRLRRIGASDLSLKTPWQGDEIVIHLQSNAGLEVRLYSHQAIFLEAPARAVKFYNILSA